MQIGLTGIIHSCFILTEEFVLPCYSSCWFFHNVDGLGSTWITQVPCWSANYKAYPLQKNPKNLFWIFFKNGNKFKSSIARNELIGLVNKEYCVPWEYPQRYLGPNLVKALCWWNKHAGTCIPTCNIQFRMNLAASNRQLVDICQQQ